jgi:oxygen-independent coproporphyrinogen-3 oxidase
VQDFNPRVQQLINRIQPFEIVEQCVHDLRAAGIEAVNFDLI